jgi:hypothetical protein
MAASIKTHFTGRGVQRPAAMNYGPGALVVQQGIYEESSTKKHRLGERLQLGDRVFRYAYTGGALVAGVMATFALLGGATTEIQTTLVVNTAAAIGSRRVYVNSVTTAQTANLFEDGWAVIEETGAFLYQVKSNTALAATGTTGYLELYDDLHIALTTSADIELMTNPWNKVITAASATAVAAGLAGVPPIAIQSGYYGWLQTMGPCAMMPYAALDLDEYVSMSKDTAGYCQKSSTGTNTIVIGSPMLIGTATEGCIVNLRLHI